MILGMMTHFQCWELYWHNAALFGNNALIRIHAYVQDLVGARELHAEKMYDAFMSSILGFNSFHLERDDLSSVVLLLDVLKAPKLSELNRKH